MSSLSSAPRFPSPEVSSPSPDSCLLSPDRSCDAEVLVRVENVSKIFCRDFKKSLLYGLKDSARDLMAWGKRDAPIPIDHGPSTKDQARGLRPGEFYAVHNVSFELRRGECLGLIGHNGAGKTTLLKMLNGLIKPDGGSIEMRGRVGALIALGAGFNPLLTGRENVYVNGSILGLSRNDIDAKIDEIIDFAEIREFIDAPVQSYSSGMQVRLGFAVASTMKPDVLILDEILAVGDGPFRIKCFNRILEMREHAAVILVSHNLTQISHACNRVLTMTTGYGKWFQDVQRGIEAYETTGSPSSTGDVAYNRVFPPVQSLSVGPESIQAGPGATVEITATVVLDKPVSQPLISFTGRNSLHQCVFCWHTSQFDALLALPAGRSRLTFKLGPLHLHPGEYHCTFNLMDSRSKPIALAHRVISINFVTNRRPLDSIPILFPNNGISVELLS